MSLFAFNRSKKRQRLHTSGFARGKPTAALFFSKAVRVLLVTIALQAICNTPVLAQNDPSAQTGYKPGQYAISVGINIYTNTNLPRLRYAVNDAQRLTDVMRNQGFAVQTLTNYETGPEHLLAQIIEVGEKMDRTVGRANGTLFLSYAGHGFQQDNQNYLAMGNADPNNLHGTSLSMEKLKNTLAESGIGRTILLIDACRNNPARSATDNSLVFVEQPLEASGLSILYSSSPGKPSYEHADIGHGVFSYFAAKAIEGQAANADGWVTVDSLFDWVSAQISGFNLESGNPSQTPWRESANNGDLRITKTLIPRTQSTLGSTATADGSQSATTRSSIWKKAASIAGTIAIGIALTNLLSDKGDGLADPSITVLIPTP